MDHLSATVFDLLEAPGHLIRRAQQQHQARWAELVGSEITSVQFAVLAKLATDPGTDQNSLAGALTEGERRTLIRLLRRVVDA
jgi:hypothetical protein